MKKNICKKRIFIVLSIIMISFVMLSFFSGSVNAEINPETSEEMTTFATALGKVMELIGNGAASSVFSGFSTLVGTLAFLIFVLLASAFSSATGSIFPTPESIVFNKIAILDVNFFNPNSSSLIGLVGGDNIVAQLYNSFHTVATSLFIIAAMVVGIKMAISTVASQKAQAKNAMINWLIGVLILFLLRLLIAGIFELNEYIVWQLSEAAGEVEFEITVYEMIPFIGNKLKNIIGNIQSFFGMQEGTILGTAEVYGYTGFLLKFAANAWAGDMFSAILLFVLLGQTVTLFVAYAKRLMYSIILGICAPLIVAIDTINKSTKGSSTILTNWFKEFTGTVFMQSFHAVFMVITLNIIGELAANAKFTQNFAFVGIGAIVLTSGIVKFEKLYKQIFGMSDGFVGGLKQSAGDALKMVHGVRAGTGAVMDNGKKLVEAEKNLKTAKTAKEQVVKEYGRSKFNRSSETLRSAIETINDPQERSDFIRRAREDFNEAVAAGFGTRDDEKEKMDQYKAFLDKVESGQYVSGSSQQNTNNSRQNESNSNPNIPLSQNSQTRFQYGNDIYSQLINNNSTVSQSSGPISNAPNVGPISNGPNVGPTTHVPVSAPGSNTQVVAANAAEDKTTKELINELSKLTKEISGMSRKNDAVDATTEKMKDADKRIREAKGKLGGALAETIMTPANVAAGIGVGLGLGKDVGDSSLYAGGVVKLMDAASGKIGEAVASKTENSTRRILRNVDQNANVDVLN